ncbi:uncharacterized protein LOC127864627 [Dreissena polymorpha]|uniref:Uncharacterized protein n=1 Tax=Dreissena polymorpha TaxID=45954 RepID=A0A9D4S9C3_DREPO|nr:uncharacterized protein LOC127864627 [Dreissena polymorpha]KAH3897464.1 hypothetical protein DPMN_021652 [Dreissena polymorpha]
MWHDEQTINGHVTDDPEYEEKDDSRPFFQRKPCEVGIYLSVYQAKPHEDSHGLEHYLRMHTTELLFDEFCKIGTVDIRGKFEARKVLNEMYIERFEPGIVLAVGFETLEALDDLWTYHRDGNLNALMHEFLITPRVLEAAEVDKVIMVTKLWDDEYEACKEEIENKTRMRVNIINRPVDVKLVKRLKNYQSVLATELSAMRDLDNEMEINRDEFMNCVRNVLPVDIEVIRTLAEFEAMATSTKAKKMYNRNVLDMYLNIINKLRDYYDTFEAEIVTPFLQIHRECENDKQRDIKGKIIGMVRGMQKMLDPAGDLRSVMHAETERILIRREIPIFLGLLSLVPIGVERVADIDIMIDEYAREFQIEFKKEDK